ncbi:hypothetical protein U0070_022897 [Myodes glareolus]|uniref:Uncharacterized protein n=1 Tax=Myodes glareolus TaxID=447135 RepID=A0AAW0H8T7_MYOGA
MNQALLESKPQGFRLEALTTNPASPPTVFKVFVLMPVSYNWPKSSSQGSLPYGKSKVLPTAPQVQEGYQTPLQLLYYKSSSLSTGF